MIVEGNEDGECEVMIMLMVTMIEMMMVRMMVTMMVTKCIKCNKDIHLISISDHRYFM